MRWSTDTLCSSLLTHIFIYPFSFLLPTNTMDCSLSTEPQGRNPLSLFLPFPLTSPLLLAYPTSLSFSPSLLPFTNQQFRRCLVESAPSFRNPDFVSAFPSPSEALRCQCHLSFPFQTSTSSLLCSLQFGHSACSQAPLSRCTLYHALTWSPPQH